GLSPSKSELVGKIPYDDIYIDDSGLEDLSNSIIKERKILNEEYVMTYGTYMYVIVTLTCPTCPTDAMHPRGYKGVYGDYIYINGVTCK
ncbi:MAG: hypothetical protein Q8853_03040, partial [Candidatus Phytoplasma australasiaticum]|nr:hypothetical protein [Candidatus Phytoplasma australasiaticum]